MKLIDLLNYVPDECEIGLVRSEDQQHGVIGDKYDAITRFAYRNRLIKEQVENMDVRHISPAAYAQRDSTDSIQLFERDVLPLYVKSGIIIEIE